MTDDLTPREVGPRPSADFPAVDPARDLPAAVALIRRVAAERHPYDGVLLGMAADVLEAGPAVHFSTLPQPDGGESPDLPSVARGIVAALEHGQRGDAMPWADRWTLANELMSAVKRDEEARAAPASGDLGDAAFRIEHTGHLWRNAPLVTDALRLLVDHANATVHAPITAPRGEGETERADAGSLDGALAWVRRAAWDTPTAEQRAVEDTIPNEHLDAVDHVLTRKYRAIARRLLAERWPKPSVPVDGDGSAAS